MTADFDNSVFLSVCEVMGERFSSLEESYIKNTEKYISDIEKFIDTKNLDKVRNSAHPLKSSSASLGFIAMSEVAEQIEELSQSDELSREIKDLIGRLPSEFKKIIDYLDDNKVQAVSSENIGGSENKIRVMHIDDDPVICKITSAFLSNAGMFETKTYLSVDDALIKSQNFSPDIILVDFMMPDMEGITSLLNLKADPRLSNIPVVFVTGLDEDDVKGKLGQGVISDYLKKPYSAETLISLIKASCRSNAV